MKTTKTYSEVFILIIILYIFSLTATTITTVREYNKIEESCKEFGHSIINGVEFICREATDLEKEIILGE